jgi:hypothetical protein
LERRVAELEARLNGNTPFTASSNSVSPPSPAKLARSQRSTSIVSSVSSADAVRNLEEENELLRTQLRYEQTESSRLRARLESLVHNSSTTSTPFPSYEPTFAFNTANINPLPQPEEVAFVEARSKRTSPLSIAQIPLPNLPLPLSSSLHSRGGTSASSSSTLMNLDSSRLVAREVELSLPRKLFNSHCLRRLRRRRPPLSLALLPSLRRSLRLPRQSPPSTSLRLLLRPNLTSRIWTTSLLPRCGTNGSSRIPIQRRKNRQSPRDSHSSISISSMTVQ